MIFVFGSNLAGRHGKGAALRAKVFHGAEHGVGEGPTGNAYAIPTKDENLRTRSGDDIALSILRFFQYARDQDHETFLLTPVGCGLAGMKARDVWRYMKTLDVPPNVVFSSTWMTDHDIAG